MFFKTIAKFDTFQFICGTPNLLTYLDIASTYYWIVLSNAMISIHYLLRSTNYLVMESG